MMIVVFAVLFRSILPTGLLGSINASSRCRLVSPLMALFLLPRWWLWSVGIDGGINNSSFFRTMPSSNLKFQTTVHEWEPHAPLTGGPHLDPFFHQFLTEDNRTSRIQVSGSLTRSKNCKKLPSTVDRWSYTHVRLYPSTSGNMPTENNQRTRSGPFEEAAGWRLCLAHSVYICMHVTIAMCGHIGVEWNSISKLDFRSRSRDAGGDPRKTIGKIKKNIIVKLGRKGRTIMYRSAMKMKRSLQVSSYSRKEV